MFSQAFPSTPCSPLAPHPASPHTQLSRQSFHSIAPSQHHCPTQAPYSSPWWVERDLPVLEILPSLISSECDTHPRALRLQHWQRGR